MLRSLALLVLPPALALARPVQRQKGRVWAQQDGRRYTLTIAPLKILDPAEHLGLRPRLEVARAMNRVNAPPPRGIGLSPVRS